RDDRGLQEGRSSALSLLRQCGRVCGLSDSCQGCRWGWRCERLGNRLRERQGRWEGVAYPGDPRRSAGWSNLLRGHFLRDGAGLHGLHEGGARARRSGQRGGGFGGRVEERQLPGWRGSLHDRQGRPYGRGERWWPEVHLRALRKEVIGLLLGLRTREVAGERRASRPVRAGIDRRHGLKFALNLVFAAPIDRTAL